MALLNSEPIELLTPAPDFQLKGVDGKTYRLSDFSDKKILVVMFICVHCPYVQAVEDRMIQLRKDYESRLVQFVGICSNDATDYPDDRPENILKHSLKKGYGFPYLIDDTQVAAKAYGAVCTPDIYVYDSNRRLAYHGRIDDNWKDASAATRQELREAIDALLAGKSPDSSQKPSMGCSIKWKK